MRHFAPEDLAKTELFKENGVGYYDFFHHRITIPIFYKNEVVHMTSRSLPESEHPCKYLHQHGNIPYAFNHDVIVESDTIYIVEGPFDCMILSQYGFPCIGVLGAGRISRKIIEDLYNKNVVIIPDSDPNQAGQKGALRLAKKLMEHSIPSYIIKWPESEEKIDVNQFLMDHTIEDFRAILDNYEYYDKVPVKKEINKTSAKDLPSIMLAAERYLSGRVIGNRYVSRCIWHEEKTGSLVVYPDTNLAYCFGCGKSGSTLDLIVRAEELLGNKINYKQAKEIALKL